MSVSTENFIKTIYKCEQGTGLDTKPGSIARLLGITNAATTDMARKLADKDLVLYEKYKALKLTSAGEKKALNILRKHRLWETFLHKVFDLSLHEIHREAELLEHQTSDFMAQKISDYLGNPQFDPHGDPIPDIDGEILSKDTGKPVSNVMAGRKYRISRLYISDKEFFDFCQTNEITVGAVITVVRQYLNNKMTEISHDMTRVLLNENFSNLIMVEEITVDTDGLQ